MRSDTSSPDRGTSREVTLWHRLLRGVAALNLVLWSLSAVASGQAATPVDTDETQLLQLLLSAGYVFGCAFRSILPVYDIPRLVLVDSRLSSVLVGRSVATIAELCFAAQWALILHRVAVLAHSPLGQVVSTAIVPLIVLAEVFSWYAVLTTEQRGHVVENSIWGAAAALVVMSLSVIGSSRLVELYPPAIAWCAGGVAYVGFMFFFDVPMYWSRWRADETNRRQYLSITHGVIDAYRRRTVSYRWEDWKGEVLWMSLYFTVGVWLSVSLVHASAVLGAQAIPH